jgi:hypothetical protein
MPRCQRTFRRLPSESASGAQGRRWVCPFCESGEVYELVDAPELLEYADFARTQLTEDFGKPPDAARPTRLLHGLRPECVLEPSENCYDLYLFRDADTLQARLQIGHEMFHRIGSRGRIFDWTHEMLACVASVRLLDRRGFAEYAAVMRAAYRRDAESVSLSALLDADLTRPGEVAALGAGLYGRAFVTGVALTDTVGWPALCRLARPTGRRGLPDLAAWAASLPENSRPSTRDILGITSGRQR